MTDAFIKFCERLGIQYQLKKYSPSDEVGFAVSVATGKMYGNAYGNLIEAAIVATVVAAVVIGGVSSIIEYCTTPPHDEISPLDTHDTSHDTSHSIDYHYE